MIDFSTPLEGMSRAESALNAVAGRIAQAPFSSLSATPQDTVDLSSDMVSLLQARNDFTANTKVFHTADEMTRTLLSMIG
ncbi:MAG: flagellar basal body rod C-terminal domain-containing protein [Bryobacteraceae bacterium]